MSGPVRPLSADFREGNSLNLRDLEAGDLGSLAIVGAVIDPLVLFRKFEYDHWTTSASTL